MKKTAKILSVLLTLVLVVSLSVAAFAEDYTNSAIGLYNGLPKNAVDIVYISEGGTDSAVPSLVKGYYLAGSDDTFANREVPTWDTYYGKSIYVKSISNYWGVNRGEGCETQSDGAKDEGGSYRLKDGVKFYSHKIWIGVGIEGNSTCIDHGIGVKPSKKDAELQNYVLVSTDGHSRFYSLTGITGSAFNQNGTNIPEEFGGSGTKGHDSNTGANTVVYEIWGSPNEIADTETESKANDASFVLIASTEVSGTQSGEFDVDVSAYKTLKLVTKVGTKTDSNSGLNCVWGNAAVYNVGEVPPTTEATEPETEPETEPKEDPTTAPTKAPAATEPTDKAEEPSSPAGLIIGIVAAVVVVVAVVIVIIKKKKA